MTRYEYELWKEKVFARISELKIGRRKYFSLYDSPDLNKKKYRDFAKEFHPDKTKGNKAKEKKFKEIAAEYKGVELFQKEFGTIKREDKTKPMNNKKGGTDHSFTATEQELIDDIIKVGNQWAEFFKKWF